MKKVLLIQYRDDTSADHEYKCFLNKSGTSENMLERINAIHDTFPDEPEELLDRYSAVILGGSGQYDLSKSPKPIEVAIKNTEHIIGYLIDTDFPTLGVCFGFQFISMLLGAKVAADPNMKETGSPDIYLTPAGKTVPIFRGVRDIVNPILAHKDSIIKIPMELRILAKSKTNEMEAFQYKNNVYGVLFHPELDLKAIEWRLRMYPEYINVSVEEALKGYKDDVVGKQVLTNFVNHYLI